MSSGPSIKIFSDYLSKIYNIPHESTFSTSTTDGQDPVSQSSNSSVELTEQVQNDHQSRQESSLVQQEGRDAGLKTGPAVLDKEDAPASSKLQQQAREPIRYSDEFYERSNDDEPEEANMNKSDRSTDERRVQSNGEQSTKNPLDKLTVVEKVYSQETKGLKENRFDKIENKKRKLDGKEVVQPTGITNDKKSLHEKRRQVLTSHPEASRKDKESPPNDVVVGRTDKESDMRHIPTVIEHVLQNKTDALSPIPSRSNYNGINFQGRTSQSISSRMLEELDCSLKEDEELLSSSYDQGLVRTFGRGDIDGPISQSTLKSAMETADIFISALQTETNDKIECSVSNKNTDISVDEKTELWTTVVAQKESSDEKTEIWSANGSAGSDTPGDKTELWTGDVMSPSGEKEDLLKQKADKTEIWSANVSVASTLLEAAADKTELWTSDVMLPSDEKEDFLKQTTAKNVEEMQRILQTKARDSSRKGPVAIATFIMEDTVADTSKAKDNVALTDSVSNIRKSPESLPLRLNEPKDESSENMSNEKGKGEKLEIAQEKKQNDKKDISDLKKNPLKLKEIKCKNCQLVLSTKEALKMHTCHSILDRLIQADGGTRRRNSSAADIKSGAAPSVSPSPKSATKSRPKKKVNSIISIKDDKLSKGEILPLYVLTQERLEEKIENDRVNEEITTLVSPRLKKVNNVFNLSPEILHKIQDKPKNSGSRPSGNNRSSKPTTETSKAGSVQLSSEAGAFSKIKLTTESTNTSTNELTISTTESTVQLTTEKGTSPVTPKFATEKNETGQISKSSGKANLVGRAWDNAKRLKVNLPKQSLLQLKRKAESQQLLYEIKEKEEVNCKDQSNERQFGREKTGSDSQHKSKKQKKVGDFNEHEHRESIPDGKSEEKKSSGKRDEVDKSNKTCKEVSSKSENGEKYLDNKSTEKKKKIEGDDERKRNGKVSDKRHEPKSNKMHKEELHSKSEHKEKLQNKKSEEKEKTGRDYDRKRKGELSDKRDKEERSNKIHRVEQSEKSKKYPDSRSEVKRKTGGDFDREIKGDTLDKKDQGVQTKKKNIETEMVNLGKKDSTKRVSNEAPKKIIVNNFKAYNPCVQIEDSPPRKRHKSDKTPSSHKEKNERKVKSEERQPSKSKLNFRSDESASTFKIPKYNGDKPPQKVKGFAPTKLLRDENIKTLEVGQTGSSLLESLLADIKGGDSTEAIEMFSKIDSKQNKMAKNNRYAAKEDKERSDIMNEGWNQVKNAKDDGERKKMSESQFGNPVPNHPNYNLSYHGYKRHRNYSLPDSNNGFWDNYENMPMYQLTNGQPLPLPGYRFKQRPNDQQLQPSSEVNKEKLTLGHFETFMKTVLYNKKAKKVGKGDDRKSMEEFTTFLEHYKYGLEETTHFLKFYQNQGQVELEGWQAREIMDVENQFSTFETYYGKTDELRCESCNKKHTFAL